MSGLEKGAREPCQGPQHLAKCLSCGPSARLWDSHQTSSSQEWGGPCGHEGRIRLPPLPPTTSGRFRFIPCYCVFCVWCLKNILFYSVLWPSPSQGFILATLKNHGFFMGSGLRKGSASMLGRCRCCRGAPRPGGAELGPVGPGSMEAGKLWKARLTAGGLKSGLRGRASIGQGVECAELDHCFRGCRAQASKGRHKACCQTLPSPTPGQSPAFLPLIGGRPAELSPCEGCPTRSFARRLPTTGGDRPCKPLWHICGPPDAPRPGQPAGG